MDFRLVGSDKLIKDDVSLFDEGLQCYADIGDPLFDNDIEELLYERSACEFVRDQLSDAQRVELDKVDAHWRANADTFNDTFNRWHRAPKTSYMMMAWVKDEFGDTPVIPRKHWWWWPIEGDAS